MDEYTFKVRGWFRCLHVLTCMLRNRPWIGQLGLDWIAEEASDKQGAFRER